MMIQWMDIGFEASLDHLDSPGMHYTLHVGAKNLCLLQGEKMASSDLP